MITRIARQLYDLSFLRFLVVGVGSTLVNYAVFYVLLRVFGVPYVASSAVGFLSGVVVGYFFNKSWTFRSGDRAHGPLFLAYLGVYLASLTMSLCLLYALVEFLGVDPLIANAVCILFTTMTNYIGTKWIVFR